MSEETSVSEKTSGVPKEKKARKPKAKDRAHAIYARERVKELRLERKQVKEEMAKLRAALKEARANKTEGERKPRTPEHTEMRKRSLYLTARRDAIKAEIAALSVTRKKKNAGEGGAKKRAASQAPAA
jgi:hypothetical protein